jgi:hypothetical protein
MILLKFDKHPAALLGSRLFRASPAQNPRLNPGNAVRRIETRQQFNRQYPIGLSNALPVAVR